MTNNNRHFALSAPATLAAGLALLFFYITFRNTGLYPTIFSDETAYSTFARLTPLSEATIPSYLYLALFRLTNSCNDGFLECARLFNTVLFLGCAPFIYLVARRLMRPSLACMCALLSVAGPANLYTLYFMPEATYFFGFWILTWAALRFQENPTLLRGLATGALLGALTLIKMHGLFVIPALCLFLTWGAWARREQDSAWLIATLRALVLVMGAAAVVRFGLGYLLAGKNGMSLFGPLYSTQAGNSPIAGQPLTRIIATALNVLRGHLMGLGVLLAVPLCTLLAFAIVRPLRAATSPGARALTMYMTLMLASLVGVTVLFTVSVSGTGFDTDQRLHMRYYDFALPLLTIFVAAQADAAIKLSRRVVLVIGAVMGAALLYIAFRLTMDFTPQISDSPALHGLTMFPKLFPLFAALALATVLVWVSNTRRGVMVFLFMLMPIFAIASAAALSRQLYWATFADSYSNSARFVRDYLDAPQLDQLTVVGASVPGLYKAKLFLSSPGVRIHHVDDTEKFDLSTYPDKKNWLLVIGEFTPAADYTAKSVKGRGYTLVKPRRPSPPGVQLVDFTQLLRDEGVARDAGLSGPEGFGRWSDASQVELELTAPLPKKLSLELKLYAFGPNVGKEATVRIGKQERHFTGPAQLETIKLDFDTDGSERLIQIVVPQPTSPKQAGTGEDQRALGLAFHELRVRDKEHPAAATN